MLTKRIVLVYTLALLGFGLGIYFVLDLGGQLQRWLPLVPAGQPAFAAKTLAPPIEVGKASAALLMGQRDPLSQLFLQLILIVVAARAAGACFVRWGQPAVIGEMVAGLVLGPSLFGWAFPSAYQHVFPGHSLEPLRLLSQIGVCLFLFVVGMELDLGLVRRKAQTAILVSHASILLPYFLGVAMSLFLFADLAAPGTRFVSFALFMGISMSITAFPVLARILEERSLATTYLGAMALTCAAVDDVTAWNLLALVVAIVKAGGLGAVLLRVGLVLVFVAAMLRWVRPAWAAWLRRHTQGDAGPDKGVIAAVLVFVLTSALGTEIIGIHALFGAFLAGVVMPSQPGFREFLRVRLENFSSTFLLPLFFAFTGLRTQIGLLADFQGWLVCLGIILVATVGKLGGSMLAARVTGMNWSDSFALGALMNTRGLMELIALNLGYDLGILSPRIFAMLVIMALVTTCLTGPLLTLAQAVRARRTLAPKAA